MCCGHIKPRDVGLTAIIIKLSRNKKMALNSASIDIYILLLLHGTTFSLCLSFDALSLHLCHHLPLYLILILLRGILHRSLSSLNLLPVCTVLVVCTEDTVPPTEGGGVVVGERHMVEIVVLGPRPEWQDVLQ